MSEDFNIKSKVYWKRMGWGLFLGLISAMMAFIFILLMNLGQNIFLPHLNYTWTPFSGPWWIIGVMTVAGLFVGLMHRYTLAKQIIPFGALDDGYLDPKPVPSTVLTSLISLISGFSLGPEVPTGLLSAGFASWISKRRELDSETTRINVLSSMSGAWSGLFSSPFAMLLILLESSHRQSFIYYGTLLIAGLSAVIGFALFYALNGLNFSSLLGILSPPAYHLQLWHLALSVLLGILAIPVALIFVVFNKIIGRMAEPLNNKPVIRSTLGGFLLGLLGVVLPTTLGLGTTAMPIITQQAATIGIILLLVFALAKIVALSGALNFGFIGGPIFPLLFVGCCLGSLINLIFPQIPLGLALGCMIVAVPAAVVPIPLAMAAIGIIIIGLSPQNALPVIISALVAFTVTHGLMSGKKEKESK